VSRAVFAAACAACLALLDPATARAGAWTVPEGKSWTKVEWVFIDSDRVFADADRAAQMQTCVGGIGDRVPYDCVSGGRFFAHQLVIETWLGIHERFSMGIRLPFFLNSEVSTATGAVDNRRGIGDIRFEAQGLILDAAVLLAAKMQVKAPTGFFTVDSLGVPLGEDQWDIAFVGIVSYPFWKGWAWLGAEAGYRVRTRNKTIDPPLNLGDEILAAFEIGVRPEPAPWLYLAARWDLLYGFTNRSDVSLFDVAARRVMYVEPKITLNPFFHKSGEHSDLGLNFSVRVPVWGRGWPADPIWILGLTGTFRVFPGYSANAGASRRKPSPPVWQDIPPQ